MIKTALCATLCIVSVVLAFTYSSVLYMILAFIAAGMFGFLTKAYYRIEKNGTRTF